MLYSRNRFPQPWRIEEQGEFFVVRDAVGKSLGCFQFDDEPQRRTIPDRLNRNEAWRMAMNFVKLPNMLRKPQAWQPLRRRSNYKAASATTESDGPDRLQLSHSS
jgi:hypothetical protein